MGAYPMLFDESCYFLAVDFDGEHWATDSLAYWNTCRTHQVPAVLERSRSGNGGHIWIFFSEPISAKLARRLGAFLLTETMDERPEVGFQSYDRFFPNQDTMPKGGFGNLIALPLQQASRKLGNSVFVNQELDLYEDQWAFLDSVMKVPRIQIQSIVDEAERTGRVLGIRRVSGDDDNAFALEPWHAPPSRTIESQITPENLPRKLGIVLGDGVYVSKKGIPPQLRNRLLRLAAFQNPEFYRAQAMRLSTHDKPRVVDCSQEGEHFVKLPRGCLDEVLSLFGELKIETEIQDERYSGEPLDIEFVGMALP